ncbi:MAG TPA: hypothetical protein VGG84_06680 [Gemmatimonadaceae bacterium]
MNGSALRGCAIALVAGAVACSSAHTYEQTYLRSDDNWAFRHEFVRADRLFNAFDYGHAILSETLLRHRDDGAIRLDGPIYHFITCRVLPSPPHVPLEEHAVGPTYGAELPEAVATFDWAHMLHRQLYDIIADQRLDSTARGRRVAAALRYYRSRPDLALSATPKSMDLMEGQPYSLAFRHAAPRFNRLIWSYHWLQMGLYDALLSSDDRTARRAAVDAAVDRFFAMLDSTSTVPAMMPMSAAIAPRFSAAYPEAAIIFDNLHALHDVVSDILASPSIAPADKRRVVATALSRYRDSTSYATTRAEWLEMSRGMGSAEMGGPVPDAQPAIGVERPQVGCRE